MNLKIWPDASLKKKCKPVDDFNEYLWNLLDEMRGVLEDYKAQGLASNQIGIDLQVLLLRDKQGIIMEIINPKILGEEQSQYENEACLSFPGITVKIERPRYINFEYYDRHGERREAIAADVEAICLKHEMEHLSGQTILNRVNRKERKRIEAELDK